MRIRVRKANDAPVVTAPELGGGYALYLDQGGRGKLEGASHEEAGRYYRQTSGLKKKLLPTSMTTISSNISIPLHWNRMRATSSGRRAPTRDYDVDLKFYDSEPSHRVGVISGAMTSSTRATSSTSRTDYSSLRPMTKHGAELWSTDGSITNMNADIMPGRRGSDPQYLTLYDDLLYFGAAGHSSDEWRIDPKYRDECDSMRRSSFDENIAFVVSCIK